MQISRDIWPEQKTPVDKIVQGTDVIWKLAAKNLINGAPAARDLTGTTGLIAVLYETDSTKIGNPIMSFTDLTATGSVTIDAVPGVDGKLTVNFPGDWSDAAQPGNYVMTLTQIRATGANLIGRVALQLISQIGS